MTHARSHRTVLQAKRSASLEAASIPQLLVLGVSWMLVMAVGLMPLVDGVLRHTPSIITSTAITFAVAVGSGIFLRRRFSWIGLMLHIYGQIAVWLSIFVLSLNVVLLLAART